MAIAQRLYEAGRISYMRTDSVQLSEAARASAADTIRSLYGEPFSEPRQHRTKTQNAQECPIRTVADECLNCDLFIMDVNANLKCGLPNGHPDYCGGPYSRSESWVSIDDNQEPCTDVADECLNCDLFIMDVNANLKCRLPDGHPDYCGGPYSRLGS